jgi:hypothetical protein
MSGEHPPTGVTMTDLVSAILARESGAPDDDESEGIPFPQATKRQTLYLSYNTGTQQTTVLTKGLNEVHLCLIQHLKELLDAFTPPEPEEILLQLLIQCFIVMRANFAMAAEFWYKKTPTKYIVASACPQLSRMYLPFFSIGNYIMVFGK